MSFSAFRVGTNRTKWCYLYRGSDEDGNLVDVRLSEKRDMEAAKAFFAQAHEMAQQVPQRVVTDGHTSYPRAIDISEKW